MAARDKGDSHSRATLLNLGVALALSIAGFLSILRNKRIKPSPSPPSRLPPSGRGNQVDLGGVAAAGLNSKTTPSSPDQNEASGRATVIMDNSISPSGISCLDREGFLLPEFDEQVKEFDISAIRANIYSKDIETKILDSEAHTRHKCLEKDHQDQEIERLKNSVEILKAREKALEIQLLEFYGLKEQETAVLELQNRLKINNVESKLLNLKIKSLKADNERLAMQVADYAKVVTDLEMAQTQIKVLKEKLKSESEHNREQILALQKRVAKLQDHEHEAVAYDPDTQLKFQKLKELEEEAEELKKSNYNLQLERSDLSEKLGNVQILATSVLEDEETERLKEEAHDLKRQNEDLKKEIERLQEDRCADVEELVYLRWVNACLRYDLRNYQPAPGKTIARDLSKSLSPKSEEKAKQLILEYANKEGMEEKGLILSEIDLDQWSLSSYLTDSGESEDSSVDNNSSTNKTNSTSKSKLFGKLMKLLRRKDGHQERSASIEEDSSECPASVSAVSMRSNEHGNRSRTRSRSSYRGSFDLHRLKTVIDSNDDSPQVNVKKSELMKYAEALKGSRGEAPSVRRRSVSISSL